MSDIDLRTIYRLERFNKDWASSRYERTMKARRIDPEDSDAGFTGDFADRELAANFTGDLVAYFQALVERDFELSWAETDYELVPLAGTEIWHTDKNGRLLCSVQYRFTVTVPDDRLIAKSGV